MEGLVTMSPYMKAYEAGIKLAQIEWMDKYANREDPEVQEAGRRFNQLQDINEANFADEIAAGGGRSSDRIRELKRIDALGATDDNFTEQQMLDYMAQQAAGGAESLPPADSLRAIQARSDEASRAAAAQRQAEEFERSGMAGDLAAFTSAYQNLYGQAPQQQQAQQQLTEDDMNRILLAENSQQAAQPAAQPAATQDPYQSLYDVGNTFRDAFRNQSSAMQQQAAQSTPQEESILDRLGGLFSNFQQPAAQQMSQNEVDSILAREDGQPAAQPTTQGGSILDRLGGLFSNLRQPAAQPAAPAAPQPLNFNVAQGGYGRQFRALQNQFKGEGRQDELADFDAGLMARAMGNRGLQVGDRFDANALVQRMRALKNKQAVTGQLAVQRNRGGSRGFQDIKNFQTLQEQRLAAQRRREQQALAAQRQAKPNTQAEAPPARSSFTGNFEDYMSTPRNRATTQTTPSPVAQSNSAGAGAASVAAVQGSNTRRPYTTTQRRDSRGGVEISRGNISKAQADTQIGGAKSSLQTQASGSQSGAARGRGATNEMDEAFAQNRR